MRTSMLQIIKLCYLSDNSYKLISYLDIHSAVHIFYKQKLCTQWKNHDSLHIGAYTYVNAAINTLLKKFKGAKISEK